MNDLATPDTHGVLMEPMTLQIQRLLPGPIERVWAYITDAELRRKWLAAWTMELRPGAPFTFTWRNGELSDQPGERPEGFSSEHSLDCEVLEVDAPRRLVISWGRSDGVTFELAPAGERVLLTVTHRRLPDRDTLLSVSAGWHAHLDVLATRLEGASPAPFWASWLQLKAAYEARIPG